MINKTTEMNEESKAPMSESASDNPLHTKKKIDIFLLQDTGQSRISQTIKERFTVFYTSPPEDDKNGGMISLINKKIVTTGFTYRKETPPVPTKR